MRRILFSLGIATLFSISVVAQQPPRQVFNGLSPQSESRDVYTKWLTEDVVYIITDEEARSFRQLKSDKEREKFIDEFWLRRDPTPGTDRNEFRDEYYERVAYANQNFAVDGVHGWQTDRGLIYIRWGQPDEIQKSASGEKWIFRRLQIGPFEFRDNKLVR